MAINPAPVHHLSHAWLLALCLLCTPAFAANAAPQNILVLGDSLSAAYNLDPATGWVSLLQQKLATSHPQYRIVNASISGETSVGGRDRLPALLAEHHPAIVIIELGANDGLRGFPLPILADNLGFMIRESQRQGAKVLLAGMHIPPNYGSRYTQAFHDTYAQLAKAYGTALVPFLLDGVAGHPDLIQADGLHPTAEAQALVLNNVLPQLQPLLAPARKPKPHAQSRPAPKP